MARFDDLRRTRILAIVVLACLLVMPALPVHAQVSEIRQGATLWYVPGHEKHGRTVFYSGPSFNSLPVTLPNRTLQFTVVDIERRWAILNFGPYGMAYVYATLFQRMVYTPGMADALHAFERSSVFAEPPEKIEAELRRKLAAQADESAAAASKRSRPLWAPKSYGKPVVGSRTDTTGEAGGFRSVPGGVSSRNNRPAMKPPAEGPAPAAEPAKDPATPADDPTLPR